MAWSLNLHHPYNPYNALDSLQVAARAINNIIGGASLTGSNGKPTVQPGLESNPANCARYTGSAAVVTRAGYPDLCATAVTSASGQAALVADVYKQWFVGSSPAFAQDASVLYQNANDPGNPQVQAILKTLFGSAAQPPARPGPGARAESGRRGVRCSPPGRRGGNRPPRWSASARAAR